MTAGRRMLIAGALAAAVAGCGADLRFTEDDRLRFVSPPDRAEVRAPLLVRWQMRRPRDAVFAVFVDRPPVRPGEPVQAAADEDPLCRAALGCPDREWLAANGIRLTRRTSVHLEALPADGGREVGDRRLHEVTVVLLDRRGVRLGESAWRLTFFGPRERA